MTLDRQTTYACSASRLKRADVQIEIDPRDEPIAIEVRGHLAGLEGLHVQIKVEPGHEAVAVEVGRAAVLNGEHRGIACGTAARIGNDAVIEPCIAGGRASDPKVT